MFTISWEYRKNLINALLIPLPVSSPPVPRQHPSNKRHCNPCSRSFIIIAKVVHKPKQEGIYAACITIAALIVISQTAGWIMYSVCWGCEHRHNDLWCEMKEEVLIKLQQNTLPIRKKTVEAHWVSEGSICYTAKAHVKWITHDLITQWHSFSVV